MIADEYFVLERENNDNYPLFSWDQPSGEFGLGRPVKHEGPIKLRLGEPISPNFQWADFHETPAPVVSENIVRILAPLNIYGMQLVPAKVRNPKTPFSEEKDYWLVHVWNRIVCLDKEQSVLDVDEVDGRIWSIDKLVLDERTLSSFDVSKRLVFNLTESTSVTLIHQSVRDAILATNPIGVRFFAANEWNSDSSFSD